MMIDTSTMVSITEANQNFSKVAKLAEEKGSVTILKNNRVLFTLTYTPQSSNIQDSLQVAEDVDVLASSEKLMKRNKKVYEELAK